VDFTAATPPAWSRAGLEQAGYEGFVTFAELRQRGSSTEPGIYIVLRETVSAPLFLSKNSAGKAKDFTERVAHLETEWIPGAETVYIGRATHGTRGDGIHRRLKQYRRTGAGTADNHGGGVWIFQLEDNAALKVCWRAAEDASDEYVEAFEGHLIADFAARPEHGRRPFANRRD
jgi:hypothetical protein